MSKILIIDDDLDLCKTLVKSFERLEHKHHVPIFQSF